MNWMDVQRMEAEYRWFRLVEDTGVRREEDLARGTLEFVMPDGRRLTTRDLWNRPTLDLESWARAGERIPTMGVLSALEADEGEG